MPRKATDLLDVFRHQTAAPARSTPKAKEPRPEKRGFQGLVLLPRHVLLGSAVVVLLLLFTFVLGLSLGRRGESGPQPTDVAGLSHIAEREGATTRQVYIEARVPYMDPARNVVNNPAALVSTLVRQKGLPQERIWIADDLASATLRLLIGPFPSEAEAAEFLRRTGLFTLRLGGSMAWKSPEYLWLTERELPATHLPTR